MIGPANRTTDRCGCPVRRARRSPDRYGTAAIMAQGWTWSAGRAGDVAAVIVARGWTWPSGWTGAVAAVVMAQSRTWSAGRAGAVAVVTVPTRGRVVGRGRVTGGALATKPRVNGH
ncbi:hypothetical protein GCM10018953_01880 [Streptosporangium nondiastaticum]